MNVKVSGREFAISFASKAEYDEASIEAINKAIEAATGAKRSEYEYGEEPTYCSDGSCEVSGRVTASASDDYETTMAAEDRARDESDRERERQQDAKLASEREAEQKTEDQRASWHFAEHQRSGTAYCEECRPGVKDA